LGSTLGLGLGLQRAGRLGLGLGLAVDVSLFGTRAPGSCVVGLRELCASQAWRDCACGCCGGVTGCGCAPGSAPRSA